MPWIRFKEKFDFRPTPRSVIAYKNGGEYLVSQACADAAIAAGKGEAMERPQNKPGRSPPVTTGSEPRRSRFDNAGG